MFSRKAVGDCQLVVEEAKRWREMDREASSKGEEETGGAGCGEGGWVRSRLAATAAAAAVGVMAARL